MHKQNIISENAPTIIAVAKTAAESMNLNSQSVNANANANASASANVTTNVDCYPRIRRGCAGYSLIELAIVLVVIGFLLSASLIPVWEHARTNVYDEEQKVIERAKRAVLGYALRHSTREREVEVINPASAGRAFFRIQAGRPYFPCPDADGDGVEDRRADPLTVAATLTVSGVGYTGAGVSEATAGDSLNQIAQFGNCKVSRGLLPWRTLGLPPTDSWGNIYRYVVDVAYSNGLFGFDQDMVPDVHDVFSPLTTLDATGDDNLYFYQHRPIVQSDVAGVTPYAVNMQLGTFNFTRGLHTDPPLVCKLSEPSNIACHHAPRSTDRQNQIYLAGEIYRSAAPKYAPPKFFMQGDTSKGVPFIIISHGHNNAGASNYAQVVEKGHITCYSHPSVTTVTSQEAVNYGFRNANAIAGCEEITIGTDVGRENLVVSGPRVQNDTLFFDDVVVWADVQEINNVMFEQRVFPIDSVPLFIVP